MLAPIGNHNGSQDSLLHITVSPEESTGEFCFNNAEVIYYVEDGDGSIADTIDCYDITHESFVFVPSGTPHQIRNVGNQNLKIFLLLTGAGSIADAK